MEGKQDARAATQEELDLMFVEALLTGEVLKLNGAALDGTEDNSAQQAGWCQ